MAIRVAVLMLVLVTVAVALSGQAPRPDDQLRRVDHLVYATPDLALGVDTVERMLGVRATPGGQHPGLGTRNALVTLGPARYLEIIGPDPEQARPVGRRRFGIDELKGPRIVAWASNGTALETLAATAAREGVKLGSVIPGSRRRPDGVVLSWRYTDPNTVLGDGIVPFFIDWGTSPHPSTTAARGASLVSVRAEHPDPERVQKMLAVLGIDLNVQKGPTPAIIATIDSPHGRVELR